MLGTLFGFKGRLSRPGFYEALLSVVLIDAFLALAAVYVRAYGLPYLVKPAAPWTATVVSVAPTVLGVLSAWAVLAIFAKRAHDRDRSGWMVLLLAVPVIGWLWLLVDLFVLPGKVEGNAHGASPLGGPAVALWTGEDTPVSPADSHAAGELDWTGQGADPHAKPVHSHVEDHGHEAHGHDALAAAVAPADDHGHGEAHAEAHGAEAHGAEAHGDDHGLAEAHVEDHGHGHEDAPAEAHGHDTHAEDHGHAEAHHDDHGHVAPVEAQGHDAPAEDHGHGHDDHGHDDHGHDDHGHGDAHAHNREHEHA